MIHSIIHNLLLPKSKHYVSAHTEMCSTDMAGEKKTEKISKWVLSGDFHIKVVTVSVDKFQAPPTPMKTMIESTAKFCSENSWQ